MTNLDAPGITRLVAKQVSEEIDHYTATVYNDGHRNHLGASLIGHECSRYLWYVFRWFAKEKFDGRQQRLFNRGHREEARFIEWLQGIGFQIWFEDENKKQFRISGVNGHFGGSLDGIARFPERYGINEPVLLEFKTSGTGAGFNKLAENGMPIQKPMHFAQTSVYASKYKFRFVLYLCINKNDDSIHIELTKTDHALGAQMEAKADMIIHSPLPPPRLSDNATYYKCTYCAMKPVCHLNAKPEVNCRSCLHSEPVENAEWKCTKHNAIIPKDVIPNGCPQYTQLAL